jgi:peptidoglycan/LPS O-acetylase OafA/YrhL
MARSSTTATAGLSRHYIPTLDGWRAIAILMVLACHSRDRLWGPRGLLPFAPLNAVLVHGVLGVDVFFGISGFLITRKLLEEYQSCGWINLRAFYWRRFFRILPAAWAYLGAMLVCALAGVIALPPNALKSCLFFWRNYNENLGWYTGQFWSLMIEEHFYLLWPAALAVLAPQRARVAAVLSALVIGAWRNWDAAMRLMASVFPSSISEHRTDSRLDSLLWACVVGLSFPLLSKTLRRVRFGYFAPIVFGVLLLLSGALKSEGVGTAAQSIARPILIPLMIASTVAFPGGLVGRFLDLLPMRFVGKISYSLYLWQQPFFILDSAATSGLKAWQHWPLAPLGVVGCALASYYLVERPLIWFGGRLQHQLHPKPRSGAPEQLPPAGAT